MFVLVERGVCVNLSVATDESSIFKDLQPLDHNHIDYKLHMQCVLVFEEYVFEIKQMEEIKTHIRNSENMTYW